VRTFRVAAVLRELGAGGAACLARPLGSILLTFHLIAKNDSGPEAVGFKRWRAYLAFGPTI
jgi:hypothetical protein